jgi:hypothetical protein
MASCWKCGRENPEGMRFCTNCGEVLPEAPAHGSASGAGGTPDSSSLETLSFNPRPQTAPTNWPNFGDAYKQSMPPVAPPKKSRVGLIVGIIVAALLVGLALIGGVGAYYYYSKSEPEVANENSNRGVYDPLDDEKENTNNKNANENDNSNANQKPTPTPAPSPTPEQSFEPPTEPTKDGTFTVYANGDWQLSQIAVVPEEEYTTSVQGIVDLAGAKAGLRAGGTNDAKYKARRLFPEWPTGALLMRTRYADGRFSNTMAVAAGGATGYWKNLPDERGMLEFRINDNAPQGNGGQFTIRVKLTKVPKKK